MFSQTEIVNIDLMSGFISSPRDCPGYNFDSEILWDNRYKWEVVWNYRASVQTLKEDNGYMKYICHHVNVLSKSFVTSILGNGWILVVSITFSFKQYLLSCTIFRIINFTRFWFLIHHSWYPTNMLFTDFTITIDWILRYVKFAEKKTPYNLYMYICVKCKATSALALSLYACEHYWKTLIYLTHSLICDDHFEPT